MVKVIETNLSMKDNNIVDFQSRVIEVDSWNSYINEIGNGDTVIRSCIVGNLHGNSLPRGAKIENFTYNGTTLNCDIYNYCGIHSKKLAYLAEDNRKIEFENGSTIEFLKRDENVTRGRRWSLGQPYLDFQREYDSTFSEESDTEE